MAIQTVQHIADVSFKDHFLGPDGKDPVNGKIKVHNNTFDVSFDNGRVRAKFASGNWFTNFFRGKTMGRFTETLQTQYDNWIKEKAKAPDAGIQENPVDTDVKENEPGIIQENPVVTEVKNAAPADFADNPNVAAVKTAVDKCFDILYENRAKLDSSTVDCSKDVMKAFAMPHSEIALDEFDTNRLVSYLEGKTMPPNLAKYLGRLGQIAELAAVRNELTTVETGTQANKILTSRLGFLTHMDMNCEGKSETEKKRYILQMVDSVINGFLQAVNSMKDKDTELVEFLRAFDGACIEAKNDNIQEWGLRSIGAGKACRSEEKDDLAFSASAEFNVLADEVKAPFREAARKECEAEVRAQCEKEGITDKKTIEDRIYSKVETILLAKDGEIAPLIRKKLETDGRFALYDSLAGAKRPVTTISKNGDKWTVKTVTDQNGKVVMKPVSAYDIDKNFSKLVDMYMEDAVAMGDVEKVTVKRSNYQAGNRMDLHARGVTDVAKAVFGDEEEMKQLVMAVKAQLHFQIGVPAGEFEAAVKHALGDVVNLRGMNDEKTEADFARFVSNYADGTYADQLSNPDRLVNLVARRVEYLTAFQKAPLANLDAKSARCAQMLKMSFPDKTVDVKKAQEAIATTLRIMVERIQKNDPADKGVPACRANLTKIMFNGRLFTDELPYDVSHRAAGQNEINLHDKMRHLLKCIEHYAKIKRGTFIGDAGQEVKA